MLITDKSLFGKFGEKMRIWQGIPSLTVTKNGKIYVTWYSGSWSERNGNYCLLYRSDGQKWDDLVAVAYAGENARCYDAALWTDPKGRLWFVWSVMPSLDIFASVCDDPDAEKLVFGPVRKIGEGVMINNPTVLSSGEWLFPIAMWKQSVVPFKGIKVPDGGLAYCVVSRDEGKTFETAGGVDYPDRQFDEHRFVELSDGTVRMYIRGFHGIAQADSTDKGRTWHDVRRTGLVSPSSRCFATKLKSGNILMVYNSSPRRTNMTAILSRDDGKTWEGGLILDTRADVSYPDGAQDENGLIHVTYDCERGGYVDSLDKALKFKREVLYAAFREEDIIARGPVSADCRLGVVISRLGEYEGPTQGIYIKD